MLHEFISLRSGEFDEDMPDMPYMVEMDCIESAYPGNIKRGIGNTQITLKSGDYLLLRIKYEDFIDIWRTCVEPININQ